MVRDGMGWYGTGWGNYSGATVETELFLHSPYATPETLLHIRYVLSTVTLWLHRKSSKLLLYFSANPKIRQHCSYCGYSHVIPNMFLGHALVQYHSDDTRYNRGRNTPAQGKNLNRKKKKKKTTGMPQSPNLLRNYHILNRYEPAQNYLKKVSTTAQLF